MEMVEPSPNGHLSVKTVIDWFLTRNPPQNSGTLHMIEAHKKAIVRELNVQLTQVMNYLRLKRSIARN
jgi:hypothetical protein